MKRQYYRLIYEIFGSLYICLNLTLSKYDNINKYFFHEHLPFYDCKTNPKKGVRFFTKIMWLRIKFNIY